MEDRTVRSLSEFLEHVFSNLEKGFYHDLADLRVMFRGQANAEWSLLPSAFRTRRDFLNEHFYIREYERQMPKECVGKSGMDILIDAQHYGIPTRLLDVTTNPLVALFFACLEAEDKGLPSDGVVLQFVPAAVFMQYDVLCSVYAEYVRHYKSGVHFPEAWKNGLSEAVQHLDSRFPDSVSSAVDGMLSEKAMSFFLLPKYSNDRIAAQEGAFLLCTTPFVKKLDPGYGNGVFRFPDEVEIDYEKQISYRYIIPAESKKIILEQLDVVGINEAKLFPDVEHRAKSIVAAIRKIGTVGNS